MDTLEEVPSDNVVIFSAHGVSPQIREDARKRNLKIIDATCPLVTKVHSEVHKYKKMGFSIVLVGHEDHDEVEGTMGEAPEIIQLVETVEDVQSLKVPDPEKIVVLTQTTLSVDEAREMIEALRKKFPKLTTPPKDDICYATQNRQDAVKYMVKQGIDLLLVVGSKNSSNSARLAELGKVFGIDGYLFDRADQIEDAWLKGKTKIGLTAGASAPEYLVEEVIQKLEGLGAKTQEVSFIQEDVSFALPVELTKVLDAGPKDLPVSNQ